MLLSSGHHHPGLHGGAAARRRHRCHAVRPSLPNDEPTTTSGAALPPVPSTILHGIVAAGEQWAQQAVLHSLQDQELSPGGRAYVLGVAHWAPAQHQSVGRLLHELQPQAVALAVPASVPTAAGLPDDGSAAAAVLPYPESLQLAADLHAVLQEQQQQAGAGRSTEARALCEQLRAAGLQVPSRLERDLLDPDEVLGFYSPLDFVLKPRQVAAAVDMFGWLPGSEHAEALQWAAAQGAEVLMLGASVRMQEAWAAALVREWSLGEADFGRQLARELQRVQRLVPPAHAAWDAQLAQALGGASASGGAAEERDTEEARRLRQVVGFKVSRACAAALLPPASGGSSPAAHEAVEAQARLQPLRFKHCELQALHVATQIKELLRSRCAPNVITKPPHGEAAQEDGAGAKEEKSPSSPPGAGSASPPPFVVVAVVGRQLLPTIHRLWGDKASPLWRGEVPRTFAPSQVRSPAAGVLDPDVTQGGSRPVGQKPLNLGGAPGSK